MFSGRTFLRQQRVRKSKSVACAKTSKSLLQDVSSTSTRLLTQRGVRKSKSVACAKISKILLQDDRSTSKRCKADPPTLDVTATKTITAPVVSNQDLILRTTISRWGKKIIFVPKEGYKGFQGEISILFPEYSVLEEENIYLEIIPEEIIKYYNEESQRRNKSEKVITPVLHVERENGAPFLRTVVVSLPLASDSEKWIPSKIASLPENIDFDSSSKRISIKTNKFSEAGVKYNDISKCLEAMSMNDDFSLEYKDLGIYLIVEQLPKLHFKFDLRKFRNWQEHRRYRMDPTKFYSLLLNPQKVLEEDYDTWTKVTIPESFLVVNVKDNEHINERVVKFRFPNPTHDVDDSNQRTVQISRRTGSCNMHIKVTYESTNFSNCTKGDRFQVPFHTFSDYTKMIKQPNFVKHGILVNFLGNLGPEWVEFVTEYLEYEMEGFQEFILKDIISTVGSRTLDLSPSNIAKLRRILNTKGYTKVDFPVHSESEMIASILSNFTVGLELGRAKREIISALKRSGIISAEEEVSDALGLKSREVLAAAMTYIPTDKMKEAVENMLRDGQLEYGKIPQRLCNLLNIEDPSMDTT